MKRLDFTGNTGLNIMLQSPVYGDRKQTSQLLCAIVYRRAQQPPRNALPFQLTDAKGVNYFTSLLNIISSVISRQQGLVEKKQ